MSIKSALSTDQEKAAETGRFSGTAEIRAISGLIKPLLLIKTETDTQATFHVAPSRLAEASLTSSRRRVAGLSDVNAIDGEGPR
jgi:hypothetical protein